VEVPSNAASAKNSTLLIVPSESDAVAEIETVAGASNAAPLMGLVMLTIGSALARTETFAVVLEVVTPPSLSVARAFAT
jgi:hypothetical protein